MLGPQQLIQQFAQEYRREGWADPRDYLDRVEGTDRDELSALIDRFLLGVPRRAWDPEAFAGSMAARAVSAAEADVDPAAAGWPELLPALRNRARLTRRVVVEKLASALGAGDRLERVGAYYHRMEHGQLPPAGVSDRVLDALAGILGSSADALRRAGESASSQGGLGGEVFARLGRPAVMSQSIPADEPEADREVAAEPLDDLDRLFLGDG